MISTPEPNVPLSLESISRYGKQKMIFHAAQLKITLLPKKKKKTKRKQKQKPCKKRNPFNGLTKM
jgi:hypothetical protein